MKLKIPSSITSIKPGCFTHNQVSVSSFFGTKAEGYNSTNTEVGNPQTLTGVPAHPLRCNCNTQDTQE